MPAKILDGKAIADNILKKLKKKLKYCRENSERFPKLVVIQVGEDPASTIYVNKKHKACKEIGIDSEIKKFPETISYPDFLKEIGNLNKDNSVNGILVQLPLPEHLNHKQVFETIAVEKDVDGFHPFNHGKNLLGKKGIQSATPKGIMTLLESTGVNFEGKNAVVVGRSNIVGKPITLMLINEGCTVTVCNSKTKNLKSFTKEADILVVAAGKCNLITEDMVKKGAIVIDVGMNRNGNGQLCGDVDFENVKKVASWITPVPKGVGPMTIASLMENTIEACKQQGNCTCSV
ncbi:MAG: bifunctional methylenetetrahydrofolate dehydrogenase/methenyltetrahydrofolate cyclohydrolase FolD [Candidatus Diapherotrites archaeon]|uniref:Bifunctional protein FolD n=1 Tax=Candidatus Iainarchaeum sp. TaxID=3101447 RepID=A0A2D6LNV9_9ARCH|nr:bifunctional methylenetetrahydrofolate dehydrogenase/methenyltetrahydrofolate cyclohydrolase FolD [Candidatus Diapherotrites archaeon]|tara:strand:- start:6139 stop:7008 length:870 start_codon:yes stop_codon:yes gene_type:complete